MSTSCSLEGLFMTHYRSMWRLLKRLGVHEAELDDAAQEVFWIAARRIDDIQEGREHSFLYGVTLRVASAHRRRAAQTSQRSADSSNSVALVACELPGPEQTLQAVQARELLHDILELMTPDLRVVFVLHELEELSARQVAELLDIPAGTAGSRLRRAREEFRILDAAGAWQQFAGALGGLASQLDRVSGVHPVPEQTPDPVSAPVSGPQLTATSSTGAGIFPSAMIVKVSAAGLVVLGGGWALVSQLPLIEPSRGLRASPGAEVVEQSPNVERSIALESLNAKTESGEAKNVDAGSGLQHRSSADKSAAAGSEHVVSPGFGPRRASDTPRLVSPLGQSPSSASGAVSNRKPHPSELARQIEAFDRIRATSEEQQLREIAKFRELYPTSFFSTEVDFLAIDAHRKLGDVDQMVRRAQSFLKLHSRAPQATLVHRWLREAEARGAEKP